ncbi:FAD-binding oxidoreductase [Vibrio sp.]|nr:FAD-binding oxidoreductase [Vibrio sp.]
MLPILNETPQLSSLTQDYLNLLSTSGFLGDIETSYASRLAVATDNSVYQQLPAAVVLPKSTQDVILLGEIAHSHDKFQSISFSPRGGGTGTNGQSLTHGIIVDTTRYMNKVLEINEKEGWARVQTGVIKDQLNDAVRPFGYFFSPDLSTSNRATIGGMINTDASGQGSLRYGKTSDHVISLQAVFSDGSQLESASNVATSGFARSAVTQTETICRDNRNEVLEKFPPLNRFLTGYDLKHAIHEDNSFDFTRVLCGAEGSLAFITEATLNLTPIPKQRVLVNVKYDSFNAALRNAPFMVEAEALSVETIDSKVLNLAKEDIVWSTVSDLFTDVEGKIMLGINMVEFAGDDIPSVMNQVSGLTRKIDALMEDGTAGIIGYQVCDDLAGINKIYTMRKKAVGLLGATKGAAKPIAFAEDTCVPPENLADFIVEFRELLDQHGLHYGMFGHVDAGVLHVRPALDMCDPDQEALMHQISDEVVKLVAKYGGLMWGEHGKGYRSEYGPAFFGDYLFNELRKVKGACDPLNRMNPGKVCTPYESEAQLVKVNSVKRGTYDRQIPITVRDSFTPAMECNGNGLCFNYDTASPMCPSMKVSYDRRHSPKGRAGLVREWLRQLSEKGVDILDLEKNSLQSTSSIKLMIDRIRHTVNKRHHYDFSHEVFEALNGCLACKACASQCPIKVDVPSFRSRFMNLYYTRYQRPIKDYLVANIENALPYLARYPQLSNRMLNNVVSQKVSKHWVGFVDAPMLSTPNLSKRLKHIDTLDISKFQRLSEQERANKVIIVQDPFTSFYEAQLIEDFVSLILKLGKTPVILPFKPNGKAQHVKGFLQQFAKTAQSTAEYLNEVADLGVPLVGVDAALVLCYRDEYNEVLAEQRGDFNVQLAHEWLVSEISDRKVSKSVNTEESYYLLGHCTEKTKLPNTEKEWVAIFKHSGLDLTIVPVGCCGMAGTFGHEVDKLQTSNDIYNLSWQAALDRLPKEHCLMTGYSCRSQVKRFEGYQPKHPIQILNQNL